MAYSIDLKALHVLRQNIRALLMDRKESEALLAQAIGFKHRSSLNKFLNNDRSGFQMWRLDKMAAFFGLPVYQLFQPGISPLTERRSSVERRRGHDRRVGHAHRYMLGLRASVEPYRQPPNPKVLGDHVRFDPDVATELLRLTQEHERKVSALLSQGHARGQAAAPRKKLARPPARGGTTGG
jgi:hypothetical protein